MSSNPYHNNPVITRSNYEEYFLLYMDDELTAEEKTAVDQFLLLNPDLQQELEILMQTKLPVDLVTMEEKDELLSVNMIARASDEALLLYVDNELKGKEKKGVEENLKSDTAFRLQYELLLKTKSDAGDKMECPFKEDLYRREKRRIPVLYWRAAAAVLLVVGMSTFMVTYQERNSDEVAILPYGNQPQPAVSGPATQQSLPARPANNVVDEKTSIPAASGKENTPVIAVQAKEEKAGAERADNTNKQQASADVDIAVINLPRQSNIAPVLLPERVESRPAVENRSVKEPLTKDLVTSDALYTYNSTEAPVNAVPAGADDDDERSRTPLKGLLRKATRFVERRTNINVTNENEELLIGSVAISLK